MKIFDGKNDLRGDELLALRSSMPRKKNKSKIHFPSLLLDGERIYVYLIHLQPKLTLFH